jgi:hypothetical protein
VLLTELQIKNAKSLPGKSVRLFDACGLYLEVSETGGRWWRLKCRYAGKEKRLSLGVYPETSLKEARERCDEARKLVSDGVDPSQQRQTDRLALAVRSQDTFERIDREWYGKQAEVWVPEHAAVIEEASADASAGRVTNSGTNGPKKGFAANNGARAPIADHAADPATEPAMPVKICCSVLSNMKSLLKLKPSASVRHASRGISVSCGCE